MAKKVGIPMTNQEIQEQRRTRNNLSIVEYAHLLWENNRKLVRIIYLRKAR